MIDIGKDLQNAFNDGYTQGKADANHWIPCTERLPEENLPVLVAVKQEDRLPSWVKERTCSYVTDIDVYDDGWYSHKNKVTAWMPLPEPYMGGEQE